MSDLDDDLLALAGAGDSESEVESEVPLKRQSKSSDSTGSSKKRRVDTSDLEFDDQGEEEDDDEGDEEIEEEEDDLVNPYPLEGKYKDEEDRENLLAMDEIQREQTLFERTQEMESYNEKKYLQQRMKQQQQATGGAKATRSSNRTKPTGKSSKLDKLSELRKQREQKSRKESRRDYDDYSDEGEEDDDDERGFIEDDEDEYGYGEDEVVWGSGTSSKFKKRSNERAKLEDVNRTRVGRSILLKHCFYSDFTETIIDCFARINIGMDKRTKQPMYRMVQISDVKNIPEKAYNTPNFKCDIYLTVNQNKEQKKDFPMSIFSDSPILPEEFDRYLHELSKTGEEISYLDDVNEKYESLQYLLNRGVSDKDVNEMIAKKQKLQSNIQGYDAVFQKTRVMDQLKIAKQENNLAKVKELSDKLHKLDQILISQTLSNNNSESSNSMSKVNERNRKLNLLNIDRVETKSSQQRKLAEYDGGDPFSRLKTKTKVFYQDLINQENEKAIDDAKMNYETLVAEKTEKEAKIARSSYRCLGVMDKLIKEIDLDLEINI
ncbi:uncharacterized protein AC631_00808 [Debaryomyces fabryi]|uniref:Plus3 domain-containing protein n=1 Tax=Debaryomyces fabryi TaxID=58627 RepID=A0A0V1Q4N1_9ASCO|nr:uncharacterized protein AC631_00808 [Debaryomyces fabryi]KSA03492.1 hypothetical protein AC631_00808 [Debaryomyces fabryi]CUM53625.1 unnamed protein product [Debaryomyces fabryi]